MNPDDLIVLGFLQLPDPRGLRVRLLQAPTWMVASQTQIDVWQEQHRRDREARQQRKVYLLTLKEPK